MTQALLNKLDITIEKTVNLAEKMPKNEGMDFSKIFESKTNNIADKTNQNTNTQDKFKTQSQKTDNSETNNNSVDKKMIGDIKTSTDNKNNTEIQNKKDVQENSADNTNEITADTNIKENSNTTDEDSENTETTDSTITENESIIIDETTITEEVPTMYNELNTLEDPTTILLLQTQIQRNIKNCLENELPDDFSDESSNLKTSDNILNNTNLYKQFDKNITKDIDINVNRFAQNINPKELNETKNTSSKLSEVINENIVKELNVEVLSSQSADTEGSFSDFMQNQSPQEQAARVMIQNDIKFESIANSTIKNVQVKPTEITPSKIIEQIAKQLDGMVNNSKLNMVLNPGSLGKVNLQLMNTKDGLTAQFTVTTQDVKDILMKGLDGLKESLLAQGINIDNVSIKLEETDNEYNPDYTEQEGSKGGYKQQNSKQNKEQEKTFEELIGANVEENSEM